MQQGSLKGLQVIHRAMLGGQVIFVVAAFLLHYTGQFPSSLQNEDRLLQVIAITLSAGGFFAGASLFKKKIKACLALLPDIQTKAAAYRAACITQWALLEGPSLFCIICFLLTGNHAFIALTGALILVFAVAAPNKLKVMLLLQLTEEEMDRF